MSERLTLTALNEKLMIDYRHSKANQPVDENMLRINPNYIRKTLVFA